MSARAAEPSWALTWEDDLTADEHAGIATLLAQAFPRSRTGFTGTRSWSSGRPELRLVAWRDGRAVAHLGILRRFNTERGQTVVLVTHDLEVGASCDRIIRMRDGLILGDEGVVPVESVAKGLNSSLGAGRPSADAPPVAVPA